LVDGDWKVNNFIAYINKFVIGKEREEEKVEINKYTPLICPQTTIKIIIIFFTVYSYYNRLCQLINNKSYII